LQLYKTAHFTEGKIKGRMEVTGRREGRCKQLLDDLRAETEYFELKKGSTRPPSVKNSLCKKLWTRRNADCGVHDSTQRILSISHNKVRFLKNLLIPPSYGEKFFIFLLKDPSIFDCR
jgi:hypothetical protein